MRWPKRPIRADRRRGHRRLDGAGRWSVRDRPASARSGVKPLTVEKCATPERVSGCAGPLARIKRAAAKRRARTAGGRAERFTGSSPLFAATLVAALLLGGCAAVRTPGPACRPLETAELPALGLVRGTWLDEEQFVLVDLHQSRLLVYDIPRGLVRIVNGRESENLALNFVSPMDVQPWGRGFVLAVGFGNEDRLLALDRKLRPLRVLWESDVEQSDGAWSGEEVNAITQLAGLSGRLYVEASRQDDEGNPEREFAQFGAEPRPSGPAGALRETAAWPGFAGELGWYGSASDLAATGGRTGSMFALRFAPDGPFVQELIGKGRRLEAFPDLPVPLAEFLRAGGVGWVGWAAQEASSYPAGLYGDEDSLYVLIRDATGDAVVWDLHRIDPELDAVVGKLRLPTNAPHVSLLPGSRYWVLEEASSGLENPRRPPIRLLLLDASAIRAGEPVSCD